MAASRGGGDSEPVLHVHLALDCQLGAAVARGEREICSSQSKAVREELRPGPAFPRCDRPKDQATGTLWALSSGAGCL